MHGDAKPALHMDLGWLTYQASLLQIEIQDEKKAARKTPQRRNKNPRKGVFAVEPRTRSESAFLKIAELIDSGIEPSVAIEFVKSDLKTVFRDDADYLDAVEWIIKQVSRRQSGEDFDEFDF